MPLLRAVTRLRVPVAGLVAGDRELPEDAARYVGRVHRAVVGDELLLFDGATRMEADARVLSVDGGHVRVRIEAPHAASQIATRSIVLVQGIGKGDKLDAIVRDATELGVTRVVPVETARTIVRLGAKGRERAERWRRVAREAARQALRGDEPTIDEPASLAEALDVVADLKIALAPGAAHRLGDVLRAHPEGSVALLVGPEGGLAQEELDAAVARGWTVASLGPFVLRTETVAAAVLGAIAILGTEGR